MDQKNSSIFYTLELFIYFFLLIFVTFLLEFLYEAVLFSRILVLCYFVLKFYFYSGLLGSIVELISTQKPYFQWKSFHHNAIRLWPLILAATTIQYSIPLIFGIIFQQSDSYFSLALAFHSQIIILYFLSWGIIWFKYLKKSKINQQSFPLRKNEIIAIFGFFLLDLFIYYLPKLIFIEETYLPVFLSLVLKCLYFCQFIYLSILILHQYPAIKKQFENKKEIYMINPLFGGVWKGLASSWVRNYPPIFVVLKALTPKDYRFTEFNRKFWQNRYYKPNKLVAITCFTSNCYEAYKIAKEFKKRGSTVIMGGPHVTYLADEALAYCDSVVVGEAEGVWKDVIKDYENNALKPKYIGIATEDFHSEVHQELLNSPPSIIKEFLEPTRGCKYRCHFCTIPMVSGGKVRKKPIPELVELIKKVKSKYRYVSLLDNNIYNDPAYSRDLFKALKPLGIKWESFCTIDIAKNKETLKLAKESGCSVFGFGYEIFGGSAEDQQRGKLGMADRYIRYSKIIKEHGIRIKGNFITGWDSDDFKSLWKLWKFSLAVHPFMTVICLLTPLPGSRLYYRMLSEDRLINLNWRQYDTFDFVFAHQHFAHSFYSRGMFLLIRLFFLLTTTPIGWLVCGVFIFLLFNLYAAIPKY